jgi:uncharacterized protein (DUF362 family)
MASAREIDVLISRREFHYRVLLGAAFGGIGKNQAAENNKFTIAISKNRRRKAGLQTAFALAAPGGLKGKDLYLKGNFTSPDECPATTHPETLETVVDLLRGCGCGRITLVERSTFGPTAGIWEKLGIRRIAMDMDIRLLPLEELPASRWKQKELAGSHWRRGIEIPDFVDAGEPLVQICNLKTHRFGGHFSASLKNSIGLIAKYAPSANPEYNYMKELHESPEQRLMIAEVNQVYSPTLVIMDATQVFVEGGPDRGEVALPNVIAVSTDRNAIDATGAALLRMYGAGPPISRGAIFQLDQLKRAAELKIGAASADQLDFVTADPSSADLSVQVRAILSDPGVKK